MTILIGVPTYDDTVKAAACGLLLSESRQPHCPPYTVAFKTASLLAYAHNALLCIALNNRPEITHLLIWHADVIPQPGFLAVLWEEMVRSQADVLGTVLAIKDGKGLTSTALLPDVTGEADPVGRREFRRQRLTLKEAASLPPTFDALDLQRVFEDQSTSPTLLVNTGLLLIDVRKPWIERCWFEINDAIFKRDDGLWYADVEPEDWHFSRLAAAAGARVCATQKVMAAHVGRANFPNTGAWGEWSHDLAGKPLDHDTTGDSHEEIDLSEPVRQPASQPAL